MKIYFFKETALEYFKENVASNIEKYAQLSNDWVYEEFENPFLEYKIDVPDFELYIDINNPNKMDLENAKLIYSNLKNISDSQATDERLWAGLAHSTFYDYVKKRWSHSREEKKMKNANIILSRYFFGQHSPKFRNTLCKLWWIGRLTYDETNHDNPFHLTNILGNNDMATRVTDLFTSNFSRNLKVVKAFLETVNEFDQSGKIVKGNIYRSTIQYLNVLGGVYLLDYFELDDLKVIIRKQINKYFLEGPDVYINKNNLILYLNDTAIVENSKSGERKPIVVTMKNISIFLEKRKKDYVFIDGEKYIIIDIYKKKKTR